MSKNMDLVMVAAKTSGAGLPAARVAQSVLSSNLYRPLAQSEIKEPVAEKWLALLHDFRTLDFTQAES